LRGWQLRQRYRPVERTLARRHRLPRRRLGRRFVERSRAAVRRARNAAATVHDDTTWRWRLDSAGRRPPRAARRRAAEVQEEARHGPQEVQEEGESAARLGVSGALKASGRGTRYLSYDLRREAEERLAAAEWLDGRAPTPVCRCGCGARLRREPCGKRG